MKKWFKFTTLTAFAVLILLTVAGTAAAAGGTITGSGTESDPYFIEDINDFMAFKSHYESLAKADMNRFYEINGILNEMDMTGKNWQPISGFNGTFNGNNVTIKNLTITGTSGVGLFGYTAMLNTSAKEPAVIKNIVIENAYVSGSDDSVGILIAGNTNGTVSNIKIKNSTVIGEKNNTGGLIGSSGNGTITGIEMDNVTLTGSYEAGLLIGNSVNDTVSGVEIQNSTVQENIGTPARSMQNIGGAIGKANSSLENINLTNVTIDAPNCVFVGGIVGQQYESTSIVKNSYAKNLTMTATGNVGGIIGNFGGGTIENCYVEGDADKGEVITSKYRNDATQKAVGGLAGHANGTIIGSYTDIDIFGENMNVGGFIGTGSPDLVIGENCYALGNVTAPDVNNVGGFAGFISMSTTGSIISESELKNCYAEGDVIGKSYVGGFIGSTQYTSKYVISDCYASGNVTASEDLAGGFIGTVNTPYIEKIENCYALGDVEARSNAGGFAGQVANVTNCYAEGDVKVEFGNAGGFAGYATNVSQSYALGDVESEGYTSTKYEFWGARGGFEPAYIGGFAGKIAGTYGEISECFAAGNVTGNMTETYSGGFVGTNGGTVKNAYSTGDVIGTYAGGFAGRVFDGNISNSYITGNVTGKVSGGLIGVITGYDSAEYTIGNNMALGEFVNAIDDTLMKPESDKIYGSIIGREAIVGYDYGENGNIYYHYELVDPVENWKFRNNYVWNGVRNENGDIADKLNENNSVSDDVILVKSYNVWDTFGKSNDALRNSAWDSSWDSSIWKLNHYTSADEYLLPIFQWQTIEKQNPEANAVYLLYLTQIDIETGDSKTEKSTDFKITVDEKEVEYGKSFFSDWEWNLKAAYSDNPAGSGDNIFDVLKNIDNSTKTYTTDIKNLSTIAEEPELYAWGTADLVKRTGPDATTYVTARLGEKYAFTFAENGSNHSGGSSGSGSGGNASIVTGNEKQPTGFEDEIEQIKPGNEITTKTDLFSWMLILSLVAIGVALFLYKREDENASQE